VIELRFLATLTLSEWLGLGTFLVGTLGAAGAGLTAYWRAHVPKLEVQTIVLRNVSDSERPRRLLAVTVTNVRKTPVTLTSVLIEQMALNEQKLKIFTTMTGEINHLLEYSQMLRVVDEEPEEKVENVDAFWNQKGAFRICVLTTGRVFFSDVFENE